MTRNELRMRWAANVIIYSHVAHVDCRRKRSRYTGIRQQYTLMQSGRRGRVKAATTICWYKGFPSFYGPFIQRCLLDVCFSLQPSRLGPARGLVYSASAIVLNLIFFKSLFLLHWRATQQRRCCSFPCTISSSSMAARKKPIYKLWDSEARTLHLKDVETLRHKLIQSPLHAQKGWRKRWRSKSDDRSRKSDEQEWRKYTKDVNRSFKLFHSVKHRRFASVSTLVERKRHQNWSTGRQQRNEKCHLIRKKNLRFDFGLEKCNRSTSSWMVSGKRLLTSCRLNAK